MEILCWVLSIFSFGNITQPGWHHGWWANINKEKTWRKYKILLFAMLLPKTCINGLNNFENLIWNKKGFQAFVCSFGLITQASGACLAIPQIRPPCQPVSYIRPIHRTKLPGWGQADEIARLLFSKNYNFPLLVRHCLAFHKTVSCFLISSRISLTPALGQICILKHLKNLKKSILHFAKNFKIFTKSIFMSKSI